jgi:hypothetical protein
MKRIVLLVAIVLGAAVFTLRGQGTISQPLGRVYAVSDLPGDWPWDPAQIDGELLPALHDPGKPPNDPDLWLVPCGLLVRWGPTTDWIKEIRIVAVEGTTTIGLNVAVDHDPATQKSKTWRLEVAAAPGPWYVVLDVLSQPGKSGQPKVKRYTVAGAGFVPEDYLPLIW